MPGLISNSFAYDLGIQSKSELNRLKSSPDALKAKIAEFESALKFVVITDYMEESLLLLKREMCWQIDDVVIGAMKVTPRAPGTPEPPRKTKEFVIPNCEPTLSVVVLNVARSVQVLHERSTLPECHRVQLA